MSLIGFTRFVTYVDSERESNPWCQQQGADSGLPKVVSYRAVVPWGVKAGSLIPHQNSGRGEKQDIALLH